GKNFEVNFIRQLDADAAKQLSEKDATLWIFADIGSGQLDILRDYFLDKKIIILDHHPVYGDEWNGLVHVNPFLEDIDGTKHISGAGVVYLVARGISSSARSMVEFAVAGACGDMQFVNGTMHGINSILLEEAEVSGRIKIETGLLFFGRYTRPIHKAIANSTEPYITGITGNRRAVLQLLSSLKIPLKDGERWRTISDLSYDEEKKLATALVIEEAFSGNNASNIIGKNFRLENGFELKELASALNACGRLEEPLEGMKLCLGLPNSAENLIREHKRSVAKALFWASENMQKFQRTKSALYIVAGDNIPGNTIGTIVSILSKRNSQLIVFGFANMKDAVKVSARADGSAADLNCITREAAEKVGGTGGGHRSAAGSKIPKGSEEKYTEVCEKMFEEGLSFS
ncbi:MAG: DHH family phosphoesterase, partial [Candidatus Aenigmarchaeota archaeon]|nr:DHH family phosphoesterase [Candidatus Aenigmarchaeota archaeon]